MSRRNFLVLMVALLILLPQVGLSQLQLGPITFSKAKAQPLNNPAQLAMGLQSHAFLSSVGGVAFGGVAVNRKGDHVVSLRHDAAKPDGQRLRIEIESAGGRKITTTAAIYDWQLVPIARFAATDQDACFTMFGELVDPAEQAVRRSRGESILGYHPAFQDTLLGLRLLQADILIIRPDACDLPTYGGRYLLGLGEQPPNVPLNQAHFSRLQMAVDAARPAFRSYVICDHDQEVQFSVSRGRLSLTGFPQWYCWRSKIDDPIVLGQLQDQANDRANETFNAELARDRLALGPAELSQKWTAEFQRQRHGEVFDQVISANLVQQMPELSKLISSLVPQLNGVNPVVYQSLITTMRYAALFRHFKQQDATAYEQFVASLAGIETKPRVETPAVMHDGNSNVRTLRSR